MAPQRLSNIQGLPGREGSPAGRQKDPGPLADRRRGQPGMQAWYAHWAFLIHIEQRNT